MGARRTMPRSDLGPSYEVSPDDNPVSVPESQLVISHDNDVTGQGIVGGLFGSEQESIRSALNRMAIFMVLLFVMYSGDNRGK